MEKSIKSKSIFEPIYRLRNRMLLFLLFISGSIAAAFVFFTKDIISPMDGIVDATKKIVNGDLTVSVPVVTEDEIGLIASLINDMNNNLTNMVNQVRSELNKYKITLIDAHNFVSQIISEERSNRVIEEKIIHKSEFKQMLNQGQDVIKILTSIIDDLTGLQKFLNMYKTYSIKSELSQKEIDEAVNDFKINSL
ncbi:MAG: HAMP domain-containing protein [Spirochaetes bacterium]|nr:HAMP domain-containing protein [Spirochaetota bacterium]